MKRIFILLSLSFFLVACSEKDTANVEAEKAVSVEPYLLNTHYKKVKVELDRGSEKYVVTEFFWYGCAHCKAFEPKLEKWLVDIDSDVVFERFPAMWNDSMIFHAKLFYIAKGMDEFEEVHKKIFEALSGERVKQSIGEQQRYFAQFFANYGLSKKEFERKVTSEKMVSQLKAAATLQHTAGIEGTPAIMVDGKYVVMNSGIQSLDDLLVVGDYLLDQARSTEQ